jgi:N-acyl-D-aspartate/D-glutamate deacylase
MWVASHVLKNQWMQKKTLHDIARGQHKGVMEAFLDLVVEEQLETVIRHATGNVDKEVMTQFLNYPKAIVGLSEVGRTCKSTVATATARTFGGIGDENNRSCPWNRRCAG